jgi:hypothetical protein
MDPMWWQDNIRTAGIAAAEEAAKTPKPKVKRLESPALAAQKRQISETGWREMDRENKRGGKTKGSRKRVSRKA